MIQFILIAAQALAGSLNIQVSHSPQLKPVGGSFTYIPESATYFCNDKYVDASVSKKGSQKFNLTGSFRSTNSGVACKRNLNSFFFAFENQRENYIVSFTESRQSPSLPLVPASLTYNCSVVETLGKDPLERGIFIESRLDSKCVGPSAAGYRFDGNKPFPLKNLTFKYTERKRHPTDVAVAVDDYQGVRIQFFGNEWQRVGANSPILIQGIPTLEGKVLTIDNLGLIKDNPMIYYSGFVGENQNLRFSIGDFWDKSGCPDHYMAVWTIGGNNEKRYCLNK